MIKIRFILHYISCSQLPTTLHAANNWGLLYDEHYELIQVEEIFWGHSEGMNRLGTNLILEFEMINNLCSFYVNH
jgi:hypothetical protein